MIRLASLAGARHALPLALLGLVALPGAALAAENLVSLTAAQRANARIEVLRLDDSATTTSAGLTVTGRVAPGGAARALVTAPVAARVATLSAYPGTTVRRGDALLTLAPAGPDGLALRIVKRRGPPLAGTLRLALAPVLSAPARARAEWLAAQATQGAPAPQPALPQGQAAGSVAAAGLGL